MWMMIWVARATVLIVTATVVVLTSRVYVR
jgi:hypothetical protein